MNAQESAKKPAASASEKISMPVPPSKTRAGPVPPPERSDGALRAGYCEVQGGVGRSAARAMASAWPATRAPPERPAAP